MLKRIRSLQLCSNQPHHSRSSCSALAGTLLLLLLLVVSPSSAAELPSSSSQQHHHHHLVIDFQRDLGAIPNDPSHDTCRKNSQILTDALQHNASGHRLVIPYQQVFYLGPGVYAKHVNNTVIQIDGTLRFERLDKKQFRDDDVDPCLRIDRSNNVTVTSQFRGLIDGQGSQYWGVPVVGYMQLAEHRPELLVFNRTSDLLIENIILQDSPYHTLKLFAVNRVEVRHVSIVARRTPDDGHGWVDLSAFNTDGIDVSGHNIHVHHSDIWVQDDCIAVKDNNDTIDGVTGDFVSSNMTFEHLNASGVGLVIGSIGGATVHNITFRHNYLHKSVKGIYLKFHRLSEYWRQLNLTGFIQNVLFENITMERTLQFSIFVGPAQQSDNRDPCFANPCSLCWPWSPTAKCHTVGQATFSNITLRNVQINNPKMSPGVLLGDKRNPMSGVVFDNVHITKGDPVPYAQYDRLETFPGLRQPIHDKYVPNDDDNNNNEKQLLDKTQQQMRFQQLSYEQQQLWLQRLDDDEQMAWTSWLLLPAATGDDDEDQQPQLDAEQQLTWFHRLAYDQQQSWLRQQLAHDKLTQEEEDDDDDVDQKFGPFIKPKWEKTGSYFRCKGVQGGVARGKTWPVPGCFENEEPPLAGDEDVVVVTAMA